MALPCNPEMAKEIIEKFKDGIGVEFEPMQSPLPIFVDEKNKDDFIVFKIDSAVKPITNGENK